MRPFARKENRPKNSSHSLSCPCSACAPEFNLTGITHADKDRFRSELLYLCSELAQDAARADRERAEGGAE